uniref:Uncharacterized protein n=1 Tax=Tetranychus urticae TaxID=32264 RepID=T1JXT6_TETUR
MLVVFLHTTAKILDYYHNLTDKLPCNNGSLRTRGEEE